MGSLLLDHLGREGLDVIAMLDRFGVRVRSDEDHHLFKYSQVGANWAEPLVRECRGVIVRDTGRGWEIASRPFEKFFNLHEGHCEIFDTADRVAHRLELIEKADGTCIQLWFDRGRWRANTLGAIDSGTTSGGTRFDDLFWETSQLGSWVDHLRQDATYLFELCTPENRIVTMYERPHCVLLAIRETETGRYMNAYWAGEHLGSLTDGRVRTPIKVTGMRSKDEILDFVEEASADDRFGKWPEGFVAYLDGRPVAKLKNRRYVELHAVGGGDPAHARRKIVESIFAGTFDDISEALIPEMAAYADRVHADIRHMEAEALRALGSAEELGPFEDRKSFALAVQRHVPPQFQSWAYQRGPGGGLTFVDWLTRHAQRFQERFDGLAEQPEEVRP